MPRATALATLITALATGREFQPAELLQNPGWWQRPTRMFPSMRNGAVADSIGIPASQALADIFRHACDDRGLSLDDMASLRTSIRILIDSALDQLIDEGSISEPEICAEPAAPLSIPALPR